MDIKTIRPASKRDWALMGSGAAAAILAIIVLFPRYEVHPTGYGVNFIRVDHWTGATELCGRQCREVRPGPNAVEPPAQP